MAQVDVVRAEKVHINRIAMRMREIDRRECAAMGSNPKKALRKGFHYSSKPLSIMADGLPIAMLGVMPRSLMDGSGYVWMLGTDELALYPKDWTLLGPGIVRQFMAEYRVIQNVVSVENSKAIAYLKYLGFTVEDDPVDYNGVPFVGFHMTKREKANH